MVESFVCHSRPTINISRDDSRFVPSQWETSLQSNAVSRCLGANLESVLITQHAFFCAWHIMRNVPGYNTLHQHFNERYQNYCKYNNQSIWMACLVGECRDTSVSKSLLFPNVSDKYTHPSGSAVCVFRTLSAESLLCFSNTVWGATLTTRTE